MLLEPDDRAFADLAVRLGLCTQAQVDECLAVLGRLDEAGIVPRPRLAEFLVSRGILGVASTAAATIRRDESSVVGATTRRRRDLPEEAAAAEAVEANRFGQYVRVSKLGAGGMGEVWKAWDVELARWVALKLLKHDDPAEAARFEREAQTAARLGHPNIAAIYAFGDLNGRPYIAMQYIPGRTLSDYPRQRRRDLAALVRDAARAVEYAHSQGVIHRDLKPQNLMTGPETPGRIPQLFVMDFGLARPMSRDSSLSVAGSVLGTPSYMPPEQARGDSVAVGAASDVYALGATLYDVLAGRPPFQANDVVAVLRKVIDEEPVPLRRLAPDVDPDLETIVMKCLEKDPGRRYATAAELADELDRHLQGEPIRAHPPSIGYRLRKYAERRKALVAMAVAGLLAVGATLGILVPRWRFERVQREKEAVAAREREVALKDLGSLWNRVVLARQRIYQPFRAAREIREEIDRAVEAVDAFVARHPRRPEGYYVRARGQLYRGRTAAAEADLLRALELEPAFAPGWTLLGKVRLERYFQVYYTGPARSVQGRAKLAEPVLREAGRALERAAASGSERASIETWGLPRTSEDDANEAVTRALKTAYLDQAPEQAREALAAAFERAPSEELGFWLALLSPAPEKMAWVEKTIALAPHYAPPYLPRAMHRRSQGDLAGAIADCGKAIEIDPENAEAYNNRGRRRMEKGELDASLADFTRAVEIEPGFAHAWTSRAVARRRAGDLTGAIADFARAVQVEPLHDMGYYGLGFCHAEKGDLDASLRSFAKALELDPEYTRAYAGRALILRRAGRPAEADADRAAALKLEPGFATRLLAEGNLVHRLGDLVGAIEVYDLAAELGPEQPMPRFRRGIALADQGRSAAAIEDLEKALALAPADWAPRAVADARLRQLRAGRDR